MNLEDIIVLLLNSSSVQLLHHIVDVLIKEKVQSAIRICKREKKTSHIHQQTSDNKDGISLPSTQAFLCFAVFQH